MPGRTISFEIDDDTAERLDALASEWKKDAVWLVQAFFEEELKAQLAGSRGVPLLRRYMYRDSTPYFAPGEWEKLREEYRRLHPPDPAAEAERKKLFEQMERNAKRFRRRRG